MKRVLIFSLAYFPRVGGAEIAVKEITDRLDPKDIEFHLITLRFDGASQKEKVGNILVHRIGNGSYLSKILFAPKAALMGISLHKKYRFNAVWSMMSYMLYPVVFMRALGVRLPYALTLQEGDTYEHMFGRWRIWPFLPLLTVGFRRATVVQAISTFLGTWARRRGFRGPLEIIPNGVNVKKLRGEPVAHDGVVLITTSRLVKKNAVDDIIRALALLSAHISLRVLGFGSEEKKLKALAHGLGLARRVIFLNHIAPDEIPRYLHAADIFIRPSRSEGMGNSFIEAMAAGLPVVATQEGGIADFLFDAKRNPEKSTTGWAVDKDSPEQIAQAVKEILSNQEFTKKVVENACKLAFEKYDWDLIARDMREKVFARLLS